MYAELMDTIAATVGAIMALFTIGMAALIVAAIHTGNMERKGN